ncbi:MAG: glycerol-3-phosphate dehydrogenase/oxidase [Candidatus Krumholzibacteria bacterium]|nr:glycerol-3-phosphate dehydrogenase/oxidase [Candidatus Krumholzibacteria bacterium]
MIRDINRLRAGPFDVLVIGGGIYGAWTAYDAALRGLKVALVEKHDWASGTSSASSKLIHGGLRYLEQFHLGMVKKSLAERRLLTRLGPHRVTPLRFLVPVYGDSRVGMFRLRAGLWLYDQLAGKNQPVGRHGVLTPREVNERYPHLRTKGLRGGLTYGDCQTDDAQFTIEIITGAGNAGAVVINHAEATEFLTSNNRVVGAAVVDRITHEIVEVRASVVVNTAGPWAPGLRTPTAKKTRLRMSKGVHLVLPPLASADAMLVMTRRDKRVFFIIPWYGRTLLGTTDADYDGDLENIGVDDAEVDYLLTEANSVLNGPGWDRSAIEGRFAGVRALKYQPGRSASSVTREWIIESRLRGLLTSIGGKYTSARADAAVIVNRACDILGKRLGKPPTETQPFPWSPPTNLAQWLDTARRRGTHHGLDPELAQMLAYRYGTSLGPVLDLIRSTPLLAERIHPHLPFCKAEIVHGAQSTMALTLEDLLRRRTPVLILAPVDRAILEEAARLVTPILGWTDERRKTEVTNVLMTWKSD